MINVIYIYTTGHFSGAAVSMMEVIKALGNDIRPTIFTPRGSASVFFKKHVRNVFDVYWLSQFDHTRHGRYKGFRWLVALRELLLLPITCLAVNRFAKSVTQVDLIHLNEITGIIPAVLLKRKLKVPLVVHVRAHMGNQESGLRSKILWWIFERYVDEIICIDYTVKNTIPSRLKSCVVHNALTITPTGTQMPSLFPAALNNHNPDLVKVGIVGSVIRVKGVYEFLDAAISICEKRQDVIFFMVGAGVRKLSGLRAWFFFKLGLTEDADKIIRDKISQHGLEDRFLMTGHVDNVQDVYSNLDILCFPSHYNAPGRPIFEAAYFGKPSIVAIDNPLPDTLVDGVTGISIKAKCVTALREKIEFLIDNPILRNKMGQQARLLAISNFDIQKNSRKILAIYENVRKQLYCR